MCDYIEKKLCDLYESEQIFDRFNLAVSPKGQYIGTGAYNQMAHVIDLGGTSNMSIEASFNLKRAKPVGIMRAYNDRKRLSAISGSNAKLQKRVQLVDWHPSQNILALAHQNCIFLYSEQKKSK